MERNARLSLFDPVVGRLQLLELEILGHGPQYSAPHHSILCKLARHGWAHPQRRAYPPGGEVRRWVVIGRGSGDVGSQNLDVNCHSHIPRHMFRAFRFGLKLHARWEEGVSGE